MRKMLIEVALPLEMINKAEKWGRSIQNGIRARCACCECGGYWRQRET